MKYEINVQMADQAREIRAHTRITFRRAAATDSVLILDFAGMTVDSILQMGQRQTYRLEDQKILIPLNETDASQHAERVTIYYRGSPKQGLYFGPNKFGDWVVFADNWPTRAHYWFPCQDRPSDKATVAFHVTCPPDYQIVANGRLERIYANSDTSHMFTWVEDVPIATYCMVLGMAKFAIVATDTVEAVPLIYYLYPQDAQNGIRDFERADAMVEYFDDLIAPFPYEKLALVQSTTQFGGMENSSAIFFSEKSVTGKKQNERTISHEISHQWFGDSVTPMEWHHIWLSEGFATYFGALFFEHSESVQMFQDRMAVQKERILTYQERRGARAIVDTTITDLFQLLNPNSYQKGSWVLHMLRGVMQDDAFFAGIREYYRRYKNGNALTNDFRKVMEEFYGSPLDWFFDEWIFGKGYPQYEFSWDRDKQEKQIRVTILQTQPEQTFEMPLKIEWQTSNTTGSKTVWSDKRKQTFSFPLEAKPTKVRLDPDGWVLKTVKYKS